MAEQPVGVFEQFMVGTIHEPVTSETDPFAPVTAYPLQFELVTWLPWRSRMMMSRRTAFAPEAAREWCRTGAPPVSSKAETGTMIEKRRIGDFIGPGSTFGET
jgi:hypothetical protein